jgi:surface-anchored protein
MLRLFAIVPALAILTAALLHPVQASVILYTTGHADITPDVFNGTLRGVYNNSDEDLPGDDFIPAANVLAKGIYDPASLNPNVVATPTARPAGAEWNFLGVAAGEPLYIFPSGGTPPSLPYTGWGTENGSLYGHGFNHVRITLTGMVAPAGGNVSVFTTPDNKPMFTAGGFPAGSMTLPLGFHDHYNMAFTAPGLYDLTFLFEGLDGASGPVVMSGSDTFHFQVEVVPEPSTYALLGLGALAAAAWRFRRKA